MSVIRLPNFQWKCIQSFNSAGEKIGLDKLLTDKKGQEIMKISLDKDNQVVDIEKFYWEVIIFYISLNMMEKGSL